MNSPGRAPIRFSLNGQRYELAREDVEARLTDVPPDVIRKHAVRINETWYPAVQAFEAATGIPRSEFISHTARRHLAALGFDVAGNVESRRTPPPPRSTRAPSTVPRPTAAPIEVGGEWHTEANVQAALVTALAGEGWRILSAANTATKEHGIDVIAARDGRTVGVEVKGFPSRNYADPARAGEAKRTSPSTQAGHWHSQAVLAAMRLRGKEPEWGSVIALPDFPRYRDLHAETAGSLARGEDRGLVSRPGRRGASFVTAPRWYRRPDVEGVVLRKAPRLASWNKSTDPDQVRLREYLEDTAQLVAPHLVRSGPWALLLEVGLPVGRDLVDMADLDNYAFPLATRLRNEDLVAVWCTKRQADTSRVVVAPAAETAGPRHPYTVRTTASASTAAYKEQVRAAVVAAAVIPTAAVQLQLSFVVGPQRNWLTLWKPTIDALDPLLGRTRDDRDWHPKDGRITDLGLHVAVDPSLGHDVLVSIAAAPAAPGTEDPA